MYNIIDTILYVVINIILIVLPVKQYFTAPLKRPKKVFFPKRESAVCFFPSQTTHSEVIPRCCCCCWFIWRSVQCLSASRMPATRMSITEIGLQKPKQADITQRRRRRLLIMRQMTRAVVCWG